MGLCKGVGSGFSLGGGSEGSGDKVIEMGG